ncbi:MAG: hypothetical protein ACTHN0_15005 [Aquihabitans sp.]
MPPATPTHPHLPPPPAPQPLRPTTRSNAVEVVVITLVLGALALVAAPYVMLALLSAAWSGGC